MNVDARPVDMRAEGQREATSNGARLMLLFSALTVMAFTSEGIPIHTAPRLVALLVAALATAFALLRPVVVRDLYGLRRAEWAVVVWLLLIGLILTGGTVARAFADLASPVWLTVVSIYTALGLAGALLLVHRVPHPKWVFPLFLLAHAVMAVALLRSAPASTDVAVYLRDSAVAMFHGHNPYSMTFPNSYPPELTKLFYADGVVVNGRITSGFPYPPVALLVAIPGQLLGDVRYSQLIAMVVTALVLRLLASDRVGRAAAVLGVAAPAAVPVLTGAWTEPTTVALLACTVLALDRRRYAIGAMVLGLFLVSKQYVVVAIPVIWLIRQTLTRRVIFIGLCLATAVTLPFLLVDPATFWKAIVEFHLIQPFRSDSISLLVSSVNTFDWPPPWTYGVLPFVGGGLTAIALAFRAPRTPAAFAAGVGLTLLVTILLPKQAFMNYYFLVSGAFLIAAVAWPASPGPRPSEPASSPYDARP